MGVLLHDIIRYPGFEDQGGKPEDKPNFVLLLKELREAINNEILLNGNERMILSIAVASGEDKIIKGYDIQQIQKYVDWIHIMTYDFHGAWDSVTLSHTGVYPYNNIQPKYTLEYFYLFLVMLLIIGLIMDYHVIN